MKKIALITCYIDNYGACLQAYSLQKTLHDCGSKCEIIRYTPYKDYQKSTIFKTLTEGIFDVLRSCKNRDYTYIMARRKYFRMYRKRYLVFSDTWYDNITALYDNPPDYDIFVTGSDQLWNPIIHNGINNKAYFLDFVPHGKKRVAYAPSIGLSILPDENKTDMTKMLLKFDTLSTREQTGADIVKNLTGRVCRVVLDPTLLRDKSEWEEIAVFVDVKKPYIFCYLFGDRDYIGMFIRYATQKTGYPIVTIPFNKREYNSPDQKIKKAGPLEFIGLIKNAALVITDSFHATAMSIIFNTPFYSLLRNTDIEKNNMNSRITNILDITGLQKRLICSEQDFPDKIDLIIDFDEANRKLAQKRNEDIAFLKEAINGDGNNG